MKEPKQPANDLHEPFEIESLDDEILALLDFEPVPRNRNQPNAWTPDLQRKFIAALAVYGSKSAACDAVRKNRTGIDPLYNHEAGGSFRAAWHAALELHGRRKAEWAPAGPAPFKRPPSIDRRRRVPSPDSAREGPLPGQVMNELGEWEDEASYQRRAEEAVNSICAKLVNCRRLLLQEISESPGKRAAFEILTELPVDWELAKRLEPQPFEPWTRTNQRQPDMVLTAESGWMSGIVPYGLAKVAELRHALNDHRAKMGLQPIEWGGAPLSAPAG